jgi:MerR family transcriptional regulator, redox-sensitive transcriptional activator SoxR
VSTETLTIGEVARRADLNASAIRYYERIGLMPVPARVSGKRRYDEQAVQRLRLLKAAQRAGFSLEETQLLLTPTPENTPAHTRMRALAERKLPEIDALIEHAQLIRELLHSTTQCHADRLEDCTVLAPGRAIHEPRPG